MKSRKLSATVFQSSYFKHDNHKLELTRPGNYLLDNKKDSKFIKYGRNILIENSSNFLKSLMLGKIVPSPSRSKLLGMKGVHLHL